MVWYLDPIVWDIIVHQLYDQDNQRDILGHLDQDMSLNAISSYPHTTTE